jgi:hypothetical protein
MCCKIEASHLSNTQARLLVCCGACTTWIIIFTIHYVIFNTFRPSYVLVDSGGIVTSSTTTTTTTRTMIATEPPLPFDNHPPIIPSWITKTVDGFSDIEPSWITSKPSITSAPQPPPTYSPTLYSSSPTLSPSRKPVTLTPTWRPTLDVPHSQFLVIARNYLMRELRDFIGLIHYRNPERPVYVIVGPDLAKIYLAELTNIEPIIIIRVPKLLLLEEEEDDHNSKNHQNPPPLDSIQMLGMLSVASEAFPGTCFITIDLSCMKLWGRQSESVYLNGIGRWPEHFLVPEPYHCESPQLINECISGHHRMLLLPPKIYWSNTFDAIQLWIKSKRGWKMCISNNNNKNCITSLSHVLENNFVPSPSPTFQITSQVSFVLGRHPKCNTHHILRSTDIHPFPHNGKLNLCFCIPTRGKNNLDWSSHPLVINTLATMYQTMNSTSPRFNRRLYIGWEDSDSVVNTFQGLKILLREIRTALTNMDMEVILMEFPPSDQDIVYLWNSLFAKGFDDGCDYLMHITDDVDFINSPGVGFGWEDKFVNVLQSNGNLGLVSGLRDLNTQPFVHRTHIEIFGSFYPIGIHNIWCDTVIWALYRTLSMLRGPDTLKHWINFSDTVNNIKRRYAECELRTEWLPSGDLNQWSPRIGTFNIDTVLEYIRMKDYYNSTTITKSSQK